MRLTVRNLLNYMDGQFDDPKDAEEIGKKIADSKQATDLFHKVRDVMRRLRLAAPSITERGVNLDCNTVAEYLDHALPPDRVRDFEEAALTSDMHLAEVASCHQIVSMVLCEPAEIEPESRQRMYQLPTVASRVDEERLAAAEAATLLSGDGHGSVPPPTAPSAKTRPRPVVPEYLRDPPKKSRLLHAAAIMFFVGAAVMLMLLIFHQFDPGTPLGNGWQWIQAKVQGKQGDDDDRDEVKNRTPARQSEDIAVGSGASGGASAQPASKSDQSLPAGPASSKEGGNPPGTVGNREAPVPVAERLPENPAPAKPLPAGPGTIPGVASPAPGDVRSDNGRNPLVPSVARPKADVTGPASRAPDATTNPALTKPPAGNPKAVASLTPRPGTAPPIDRPAAPPAAGDKTKIGRYRSDGMDVLLKFEADNSWRRVLPEEFLIGRQPLLALPSYRPRVVILNVGAMLELVNATCVELLPDNAQGQPGLEVEFGRLVIKPVAQADVHLRVVVGSHTGVLTLATADAVVGLEVTRLHEQGKDPEKVLSHALTKLYVAHGMALWQEAEAKQPVKLTAPAELLLDGAAERAFDAGKDMPKWITADTVNELDKRAAISVSQALPADRAASLSLNELADPANRLKEIRWLAARCLGYLRQFDPLTAALNEVDFRREWPDYFDQLKEAIARGPETAAAIRQSLERKYGSESAGMLYRMLWGYTDKQLADGEDDRLVSFLNHESPVFRVLAFENLKEITGKTLYYHPEAPTAPKRQQFVQRWRREQQAGHIRFNLPDGKPAAAPAGSPSKETAPEPAPPPDESEPGNVNPTSALEPIAPDAPASPKPKASKTAPPRRLPVSVPEPEPPERRPPVAFPEP